MGVCCRRNRGWEEEPPATVCVLETCRPQGYSLCVGDVPPARVCLSQFLSGKGAVFQPQQTEQGYALIL